MPPEAHSLRALQGNDQGKSYELIGKLAVGGMAELFLARSPTPSGRGPIVVLKRILPHLSEDPEFVRMFRDEAFLAATLQHPNIVRVFDIGQQDDEYFFTMEYVHGENLRAILRAAQKRGESIPLAHILTVGLGVTAALHHAHEQVGKDGRPLQIVHRDVSPTNVLVAYDGSLKIVDFGIAKAAAGTHVTQAGMLKGKASYMSPEQCRSGQVDRRSDVFAIGILLYEMTTLTRLFRGDNELAILHQVLSGGVEPPSSRRPGYPADLERIVLKALAQEPEQRYQTAEELGKDIARFGQQNGLRPSTPALGQYLRGLFGNKPLPWDDGTPALTASSSMSATAPRKAFEEPEAPEEGDRTVNRKRGAAPTGARGTPPRPPVPARRGPRARTPSSARQWRPGGQAGEGPPSGASSSSPPKAPTPPRAPAAAPRPSASVPRPPVPAPRPPKKPQPKAQPKPAARARVQTGPRTSTASTPAPSRGRPGARPRSSGNRAAPPKHAPSRSTAPRGGSFSPPVRPGARPPRPSKPPGSPAVGYSPPLPEYEVDPEESKTAIAPAKSMALLDAKTQVTGTSTEEVRKFLEAAPPAELGGGSDNPMVVKTQVAATTAEEIQAFIAAAPPAELAGGSDNPMVVKTQVAPATAEEIQAFIDAAQPPAGQPPAGQPPARPAAQTSAQQPAKRDLFAAPAAPPASSSTVPASPNKGPIPLLQSPPLPGANRAPARTGQTIAPDAELRAPHLTPPSADDLEEASTIRMSARHAVEVGPLRPANPGPSHRPASAPLGSAAPVAQQPRPMPAAPNPMAPHGAPAARPMTPPPGSAQQGQPQAGYGISTPGVNGPGMNNPMTSTAPAAYAQPAWGVQGPSATAPMHVAEFDDEPLEVPGRRSKLIALVITVVLGVLLGGGGVWYFLG